MKYSICGMKYKEHYISKNIGLRDTLTVGSVDILMNLDWRERFGFQEDVHGLCVNCISKIIKEALMQKKIIWFENQSKYFRAIYATLSYKLWKLFFIKISKAIEKIYCSIKKQ